MAAPRVTIDQLPEQTAVVGTDLLVVQNGATTKKITMTTVGSVPSANLAAHTGAVTDAHDATAISAAPGTTLTGGDVQTQLGQADVAIADLLARVAALEAP